MSSSLGFPEWLPDTRKLNHRGSFHLCECPANTELPEHMTLTEIRESQSWNCAFITAAVATLPCWWLGPGTWSPLQPVLQLTSPRNLENDISHCFRRKSHIPMRPCMPTKRFALQSSNSCRILLKSRMVAVKASGNYTFNSEVSSMQRVMVQGGQVEFQWAKPQHSTQL